ncbi:MAG: LytTR family transcriptional regulator [Balneolaceae bacterium]|nr:LytTR family transcriptional regulator [Balneolaceae bacterium]
MKNFPKNYLLKYPARGALIIALFNFVFLMIYQPAKTHPGYFLSYEITMALYCIAVGFVAFVAIYVLRLSSFYTDEKRWNIIKEISAIFIVLFAMGITVYFMAFLIEEPANRWNADTLFDSISSTFLIGGIPLYLFTIVNINQLFQTKLTQSANRDGADHSESHGHFITIDTALKKENLSFYASKFLYAESEGNYVNFYLHGENGIQKKIVRGSISSVEEQLSEIPFLLRTHRAFIVNLKKVEEANGNALGFRLKIKSVEGEIPVSRRQTDRFRALYSEYG